MSIVVDPYLSYWCGKGKDGLSFKDHSPCHDSDCECGCHQDVDALAGSLWCQACKGGRHGDCVGTIECTCYAYAEAHADPPVDPVCGTPVLETAKHFLEKDLSDE